MAGDEEGGSGSSHVWQGSPHVPAAGGLLCASLVVVGPQQQGAGPLCGEKKSRVQGKSRHIGRRRPFGGPENISGAKFLNNMEMCRVCEQEPLWFCPDFILLPRAPFWVMGCANLCSDQLLPGLMWKPNNPSYSSIVYFSTSVVTVKQETR